MCHVGIDRIAMKYCKMAMDKIFVRYSAQNSPRNNVADRVKSKTHGQIGTRVEAAVFWFNRSVLTCWCKQLSDHDVRIYPVVSKIVVKNGCRSSYIL